MELIIASVGNLYIKDVWTLQNRSTASHAYVESLPELVKMCIWPNLVTQAMSMLSLANAWFQQDFSFYSFFVKNAQTHTTTHTKLQVFTVHVCTQNTRIACKSPVLENGKVKLHACRQYKPLPLAPFPTLHHKIIPLSKLISESKFFLSKHFPVSQCKPMGNVFKAWQRWAWKTYCMGSIWRSQRPKSSCPAKAAI